MKKVLLAGLVLIALLMSAQCVPAERRSYYGDEPIAYPDRHERASIENRFTVVQQRIDTYKRMGRLPELEARDFQIRLDGIKTDYLRLTEGGTYMKYEDSRISRRLDQLENDLDNYRW